MPPEVNSNLDNQPIGGENQNNSVGTPPQFTEPTQNTDQTDSQNQQNLEKSFSQDQVSRMMSKEKAQGRSSVYNDLGIDPKDDKTLQMVKAFIQSQKTTDQKEQERENQINTAMDEMKLRAIKAEIKAEIMLLGIGKEYIEDAADLMYSKISDDLDAKTLAEEMKKRYPVWFSESMQSSTQTSNGTGNSLTSNQGSRKPEETGIGARLAAQRKKAVTGKSYWGQK